MNSNLAETIPQLRGYNDSLFLTIKKKALNR